MLNSPLLIKGSTRKGEGLEDILLQYQHESMNPCTELTLTYSPDALHRDKLCVLPSERIKNFVSLCVPLSVSLCVNLKHYSMSGNLL